MAFVKIQLPVSTSENRYHHSLQLIQDIV